MEQGYGYRVIPHAPGLRDALVFLYTIDNGAPPNATQVSHPSTVGARAAHKKLKRGCVCR